MHHSKDASCCGGHEEKEMKSCNSEGGCGCEHDSKGHDHKKEDSCCKDGEKKEGSCC